jgi:hypothetical protein
MMGPGTLEKGIQWITLQLKNVGDVSLHSLDIKMHSADSLQISFRSSTDYINLLTLLSREYKRTIILVTHNPELAAATDRAIHIRDGAR